MATKIKISQFETLGLHPVFNIDIPEAVRVDLNLLPNFLDLPHASYEIVVAISSPEREVETSTMIYISANPTLELANQIMGSFLAENRDSRLIITTNELTDNPPMKMLRATAEAMALRLLRVFSGINN